MTEFLHRGQTSAIIGAAIEVHNHLGPGLLESAYESALAIEFDVRRVSFRRQVPLVVKNKGVEVGEYRADFVIAGQIILEIKSCPALIPAHFAQALNYLATTGYRLALLINFGTPRLQVKRLIR